MLWRPAQWDAPPEGLREAVGGHPLVAQRLAAAGALDPERAQSYLDPRDYRPGAPGELPGLTPALQRLRQAIDAGEKILLRGDQDVDGLAATALLKTALERIGAKIQIQFRDRNGDQLPATSEDVNVILTLVRKANNQQPTTNNQQPITDLIVIDHRSTGAGGHAVFAEINSRLLPEGHPMRELPRVALAYELALALDPARDGEDYLDLVALGIIGDFAQLRHDTRHLLQRGIAALRVTRRLGLQEMFKLAGIDALFLDETDIGLSIAPRLGAQGRLGDAADGVELLTTSDAGRAVELANQIEGMNAQRKLEARQVLASARSLLEREPSLLEYAAIVLAHPDWSPHALGSAAARLANEFQKPVALLREREGAAVGRAHTALGLNLAEPLAACRFLLERSGGNETTAFLRLRSENLFEFRRQLSRSVREKMSASMEEPALTIDADVKLSDVSMDFVRDLRRLAPFGPGNPAPALAARSLRVVRKKKLGRERDHLEMLVEDETGARQRVFWWNAGEASPPVGRFDLAFTPVIKRFQGHSEIALELLDLHALEPELENEASGPAYEVEDFSRTVDPRTHLAEVLAQHPDALVWREADADVQGVNRAELTPTSTLIVWTPPPGPEEWQTALDKTRPQRIIVFAQSSSPPTLESFLQRLGGLLKHVINSRGGEITLAALGGATAQRASTVQYGIQWFEARGSIQLLRAPRGSLRLIQGTPLPSPPDQTPLEKLIKASLAETAAYRKHWTV